MKRKRDALPYLIPLFAAAALLVSRIAGATPPTSAGTEPRLVILAFAFEPTPVPNLPAFQGMISREIPREIGRRMDALADLETRFYAVRSDVGGKARLAVTQRMRPGTEVRLAARRVGGAFVLDGLASVTARLQFRVRLQDVKTARLLWQKEYQVPTAEAGKLLDRAARDLLLALPGGIGAGAKTAPPPAHEPGWDALVAYMEAEDLAFALESGVYAGGLDPIFDRYLTACQKDPAWGLPAEHLAALAHQALSRAVGPAEVPLRAIERLAQLRPGAPSQAALARGLERAGRASDAEAAWQRSLAIDPKFIEGWLNVGEARRKRGDYRGAASDVEKAVALGLPTPRLQARAQSDLGALYLEINEVDKAIAQLEASVKLNPGDPDAHFRLGSAYDRKAQIAATEVQSPEVPSAGRANDKKARADDKKESSLWVERATKEFKTVDRLRGVPEAPRVPPGAARQ